MKTVTTKELTGMSGLSWGTLNTYVHYGWIQPPQITPYGKGNGRGSRLLWKKVVGNQIKQIQSYKKTGMSLNEIDKILKEKN